MFITLLPINFNSSQVRLEHNGGIYAGNNNAFQFQLGTIGTNQLKINHGGHDIFQFQLGTIGTCVEVFSEKTGQISIPVRYDWNSDHYQGNSEQQHFNSS